jgi:hypothetical protein
VSSNPIIALGDTGFERDTGRSKIGDGVKAWNDLNYFNEASGGGGGRDPIDPVEFGDPVTAKLRYESIPAGGLSEIFYDDFTTDTLADITRYPFGAREYTVVSGKLTRGPFQFLETAGKFFDGRVTCLPGASYITPAMRRVADTDCLFDDLSTHLYKIVGGVYTNLGPWSTVYTAGDYTSLLIDGNNVNRQLWTADPLAGGVLKSTATIVLSNADGLHFGRNVEKYGAVYGNSTSHTGDNLRVEKTVGEQRRLMADIDHPAGGVISTEIARA